MIKIDEKFPRSKHKKACHWPLSRYIGVCLFFPECPSSTSKVVGCGLGGRGSIPGRTFYLTVAKDFLSQMCVRHSKRKADSSIHVASRCLKSYAG